MLPKKTIKKGKRIWAYTNQSFADYFIYRSGDDLALVNNEGEFENTFLDAFKEGDQ